MMAIRTDVGTTAADGAPTFRKLDDMTFKEILSELEDIVRTLEGNTLELEDSLRLYERGVELLRVSKGRLADAQQKVTTLMGELEVDDDDSIDGKLS